MTMRELAKLANVSVATVSKAFSGAEDISDDEIDKLITNQVLDSECDLDKEIEARIQDVREKLNA